MIKLSVVVIAYNLEKYISGCLKSIANQTYKNFELIIVNDGSADNTAEICNTFAENKSNVRVIHQENKGSVLARYAGVCAAKGDYISLVDGDDWLEPDMYEKLMKKCLKEDADLITCGYFENRSGRVVPQQNAIASGIYKDDALEKLRNEAIYSGEFYVPGIIPALWNKVIKTNLVKEVFDALVSEAKIKITLGDDAAITYPLLQNKNIKCVIVDNEENLYHYRMTEGSLTSTFDLAFFDRIEELFKILKNKNLANVNYYILFMVRIGIYRFYASIRKWDLITRYEVTKKQLDRFKISSICKDIDWNGFNADDQKEYKIMAKGTIAYSFYLLFR